MTIRRLHPSIAVVLVLAMTACQPTDRGHESEAAIEPAVVEVTALDYAFQAPDTISSGWATFRMKNQGGEDHFLLLNRLPEGKALDDYGREVGVPFEIVWDSLKTGAMNKAEAGQLLSQLLPAWYAAVRQMGGVGLLGAGRTGETTVNLEPGTYVMECTSRPPMGGSTRRWAWHGSLS